MRPDVVQRLLICKSFLGEIRFVQTKNAHEVARHVLVAHTAAELALSAIVDHLGYTPNMPKKPPHNFGIIDYSGTLHNEAKVDLPPSAFIQRLNLQRVAIKHQGQLPNVDEWATVGRDTFDHISNACKAHLGRTLVDIDDSALLEDEQIATLIAEAKQADRDRRHKEALELLARALFYLIKTSDNPSIRGIPVGVGRATDATALMPFGVDANSFLCLQDFLPRITEEPSGQLSVNWQQDPYGHPGNWTEQTVAYCLKSLVELAVRVQSAPWTPLAINFWLLYEFKVTALEDDVKITSGAGEGFSFLGRLAEGQSISTSPDASIKTLKTLKKGEFVVGQIWKSKKNDALLSALMRKQHKDEVETVTFYSRADDRISGEIDITKVVITCVPRQTTFVREHYPFLKEIPWDGKARD
ncbi:MAG: hypothetical protein HY352_02260 [Candidatus Omnitrophica bacterium]|nr:hypothetical protein [Candidatus Omnitrophota bacterium]